MIIFKHTLLPEPVEPATSKCGIVAKSQNLIAPEMFLPRAKGSADFVVWNSGVSITSFNPIVATFVLGNSIPTKFLPGIGA